MMLPGSLQARLALSLGALLTVLWLAAAWVTGQVLRHEMDEVFDSALQETAQRLLPLAVLDILSRDDDGVTQRLGAIRTHGEFFTYVVRDAQGRILLQSHTADPADFPAYDGPGFRQTDSHRLYSEDAVQGTVRITVAEPLPQRAELAGELQMVLALPILVVIPIALLAIILAVRASLTPLRRFRESLAARSGRDLSPVPVGGLPAEILPVATTLNDVLDRLKAAFDAERSFAANAAHELRNPLAGAIAQAQRLQVETKDATAARRAADIEAALKRLTRMAERLLQLARAEGGPLRLDHATDLRVVARLIIEDMQRATATQIRLVLPDQPVLSDLDPDAFGIICRNLVENALRHGTPASPIDVALAQDGRFRVANDGPLVSPQTLSLLTRRFERGGSGAEGSGLGLAIVAAIADRISTRLILASPRSGTTSGFEAALTLPIVATKQH
ncbi:ATP-binding protein [Cypionkella sp.]|uniref:ATP-binding protein n=1 Tax=Cypionkella sp. TaxID=2811411 RepID=UPI002AB95689|nr:ATP-binding protein [Cypionkella sp.]MDZ4391935.1 histidine kinase dimerization/phospho-acceptor domain-containing protein [Cypionkella sp.]